MSTAADVAADLVGLAAATRARVRLVVARNGGRLQAAVKHHANEPRTTPRPGPGGPRLLTGDYNRSIALVVDETIDTTTATVGTNKPQGRRLEFGFTGFDALGRSYDQKAYPHFGPGLDEVAPVFRGEIADAARPRP